MTEDGGGRRCPVSTGPTAAVLVLAAGGQCACLVLVVRRRDSPGAFGLAALLASVLFWDIANAVELRTATIGGRELWGALKYLGIGLMPPAWLTFVAQYTGTGRPLARRTLLALSVVPIVMLGLLATPHTRQLLRHYPSPTASAADADDRWAGHLPGPPGACLTGLPRPQSAVGLGGPAPARRHPGVQPGRPALRRGRPNSPGLLSGRAVAHYRLLSLPTPPAAAAGSGAHPGDARRRGPGARRIRSDHRRPAGRGAPAGLHDASGRRPPAERAAAGMDHYRGGSWPRRHVGPGATAARRTVLRGLAAAAARSAGRRRRRCAARCARRHRPTPRAGWAPGGGAGAGSRRRALRRSLPVRPRRHGLGRGRRRA